MNISEIISLLSVSIYVAMVILVSLIAVKHGWKQFGIPLFAGIVVVLIWPIVCLWFIFMMLSETANIEKKVEND